MLAPLYLHTTEQAKKFHAVSRGSTPGRLQPTSFQSGRSATGEAKLIGHQFADSANEVLCLWQNFVLKFRLVRHKSVRRGHPANRSVQLIE